MASDDLMTQNQRLLRMRRHSFATMASSQGFIAASRRNLPKWRHALSVASWIAAAATGAAAFLSASVPALTFLRLAGAAYLIFLGIQGWRDAGVSETPQPAGLGRVFAQGFVTQILNPKVAVFFVAFLPQFLNPVHPIAPQVAVLGAVYIGIAIAVDASYVMSAASLSSRFIASAAARRRTGRIAAPSYVALGLAADATGCKQPD